MRLRGLAVTTALVGLALAACDPSSLTEARDQLQRGGDRLVRFSLPVTVTNLEIADFVPEEDTVTTPSGLLGLRMESQVLTVDVGDEIEFDDINFDNFSFDYGQVLATDTATSVSFQQNLVAPSSELVALTTPAGSRILEASILGGFVVRDIQNNTACDATINTLVTDSIGTVVAAFPPTVVGAGASLVDSIPVIGVDEQGLLTISPAGTNFGACMPAGGTFLDTDVRVGPFVLDEADLQNINEPFSDTYSPLESEDRLLAVDTVVATGQFAVSFQNRLPIPIDVNIELQGVFRNGTNASGGTTVPAAPGDGSQVSAMIVIPLAGDTMLTDMIQAVVSGVAASPAATFTPITTGAGVEATALGSITADAIAGTLDPDSTPELSFDIEAIEEVDASELDFGDFEDAVRQSSLNDVTANLDFLNGADAPLQLQNLQIGVALLDGTGDVVRDTSGAVVFETDSLNQPLIVTVLEAGDTIIPIARSSSTQLDVQLSTVFDRIIELALDDIPVALVATGRAVVGDGAPARIESDQQVEVSFDLTVGLDFTIGAAGVSFDVTEITDGLDLDADDSDELASRVVTATLTSEVTNGTPFGLEVDIAFVAGNLGEDADVFGTPGAVELETVTVDAATVGPDGVVTSAAIDVTDISISGEQSRPLLQDEVTSTVRIRLLPGTGGGGRTAVRPDDRVAVRANAVIEIRAGGAQ